MLKNYIVILVCLISLFSCDEDDFGNNIPESEPINEQNDISFQAANFGESVSIDLTGRVIDEEGNGVLEAQVKIGTSITETDNNGVFVIQNASAFKHFAFLSIRKDGYITGSRSLIPDLNTINDVQVTLLEKNIVATVQTGESSTVTLGESSVSFTGSFIDENNNPYTGAVEVSMHYLQPNQRNTFEQMPGMLFAQNVSNQARSLETYGMVAINLFSPNGDMLNIAEDSPATIEFPVDNTQVGIAPERIPLWFFDENVGYWKEQGEALKVGDTYIGEVTHFTWWNCDLPLDYIEVCITLLGENGGLAANFIQIIRNETGQIIFQGIVNQDGNECGLFPVGEDVTLKVFGVDDCVDQQVYETQLGPYSADTIVDITIPEDTIDQTTLIGAITNCDGMPLDNGIGLLINSFGQIVGTPFTIENGVLDYTFAYCTTSYEVLIIDQEQNQTTGLISVSISSEETNIGALSTCVQQGGVFEGDVTLENQEEINAFGIIGYSEITGTLLIRTGFQQESVTSVAALNSLTTIGGDLNMFFLFDLESLEGLDNLTSISGNLSLAHTSLITSLDLWSGITSEVPSVSIIDNIGLESLSGLENLQIANDGSLIIEGNDLLTNLDALNGNIPEILNTFRISPRFPPCADICNPPIPPVYQPFTDLSFLSTVNEIFFLRLRGFQGDSFEGIQNILTANRISVWECPNVTDLTSMSSIEGNVESLFIESNEQLASLNGLDGILSISNYLGVSGNEGLTDYCTLTTSISNQVPETFFISNNAFNPTIQDFLDGNCSN